MRIDHICFYVTDAAATRNWMVQRLGFNAIATARTSDRVIEMVTAGSVTFLFCSPTQPQSPIADYLQRHPCGVADVAFQVADIREMVERAVAAGATLLQPIQTEYQADGCLRWATIAAWGDLTHTFIERSGATSRLPGIPFQLPHEWMPSHSTRPWAQEAPVPPSVFSRIDHLVLNVERGDLEAAVAWYKNVLGFQPQQQFDIQTEYSALSSRVMQHPEGWVQIPINESASPNSQIQEFLDVNRGAGIQHIALETIDLVKTVHYLRQRGLSLLSVPQAYYAQLRQRPGLPLSEAWLHQIEAEEILVDWQSASNQTVLLQTFTHPIFGVPTFFFELIERQMGTKDGQLQRAEGFGEGNFRALFEAIEREQIKRGSLTVPQPQT